MKFHELSASSKTKRKRVGRGISSGHGKTAGRGTKGQNSRTGGGVRPGFEGGQNPLMKRIPKSRGFSKKQKNYNVVFTDQLNTFDAKSEVTKAQLLEKKLIPSQRADVKLVKRGDIKIAVKVKVDRTSKGAQEAIEQAGGAVILGSQ